MAKKKKSASNFDVMKAMSEQNLDIRVAPLGNIIGLSKNKKGFKVEIGIDEESGIGLLSSKYIGGFYLMDRVQFAKVQRELEEK